MGMEQRDDIVKVYRAGCEALGILGLPFAFCSFCSINREESQHRFIVHSFAAGGEVLPLVTIPVGGTMTRFWGAAGPVYRPDLYRDDPYAEREALKCHYGRAIRAVIDVPFS